MDCQEGALCFKDDEGEASNLFQLLHTHFLDYRLPDLVRHPCWCALRLLYLFALSGKYMHFLGSPLSQLDICMTPIRCLKSRLPGLLSRKDPDLVAILIPEGEAS